MCNIIIALWFEGLFIASEAIWTQLLRERASSEEPADTQTVSHSSAGPGGRRPQHPLTGRKVDVLLQVDFTATTHRRAHSRVTASLRGGVSLLSMFSFALGSTHAILPLVSLFLIKDRQDTPETRSWAKDCVVFIFDTSPAAQELIIFSTNGFNYIRFFF